MTLLRLSGIRFKCVKVSLCLPSITYLGHVIDSSSTFVLISLKVIAILECLVPTDFQQLCFFLGLAHYFCKFVSKFSTIAVPLYRLTLRDVTFTYRTF